MDDPKKAYPFDPEEVAPHRFEGRFEDGSDAYLRIRRPDGAAQVQEKIKLSRVGHRPESGIRRPSLSTMMRAPDQEPDARGRGEEE